MKKILKTGGLVLTLIFLIKGITTARDYQPIEYYTQLNQSDRSAYIAKYKDLAIAEMERVGIPASIKLAQGILESNNGNSRLAKNAKNHFGMKCGSAWKGKTYALEDDDYDSDGNLVKSCFRVFETAEASYKAHSEFLLDEKKIYRYGFLFDLDMRDYKAWAKALKKAGYATNPKYPELLIKIIEANRLYEYDYLKLFDLGLPGYRPTPVKPVQPVRPTTAPVAPVTVEEVDITVKEVVLNNGVRMMFAQAGDTPQSIEEFSGITAKKITLYNELYEGGRLNFKEGDRIYLQPKRKRWRGKKRYHLVQANETMYEIAQLYGLRVESLYYRNRMRKGTQPAKGQRLSLKRRIKRNTVIRLRNPKLDPVRPVAEKPRPTPVTPQPLPKPAPPLYNMSDGKNLVDVIRMNVNAHDMEKRADAYLKITKGRNNYVSPTRPVTTRPTPTRPVTTRPTPTRPVTTRPTPTRPQPVTTQPTTPTHSNSSYHRVQSGDTLYAIARKYQISVSKIKALNKLNNNIISVGQMLRVK